MTQSAMPSCFTRLPEMDDAWGLRDPGARLAAVRDRARALHDRISAEGKAVSVRTFPTVSFPYPTSYGLGGAARSLAPFVMMRNRMQLVQVADGDRLVNILVNPSDPERSLEAPFFATQLAKYGEFVSRRIMTKNHGSVATHLRSAGIAPAEIDYITFDHLHVQDVRGWLGTTEPEEGFDAPTEAFFPNAKLLAQDTELATFEHMHPLQRFWYVADCLRGVSPDKIVSLDGDYLVGAGFALVRTPGHTHGNHSLVMNTDRGLWTVSENGIAVECYAPEHSKIRGLRDHARVAEVEVILNANTRENSLDQYSSMVLEKTLADPCTDRPEFPQHFPSSELVASRLAPGLKPTYSHGHITHGTVVTAKASFRGAASSAA